MFGDKIDETQKMCIFFEKMHSFCSPNPDPENAFTFGRFFGVAKTLRNAKIGTILAFPTRVYLKSIYLSVYLSIYLTATI